MIIALVGLIGNSFVILTFHKQKRQTSATMFLKFLALFDILLIISTSLICHRYVVMISHNTHILYWIDGLHFLIGHVNEYPTIHCFGIPKHSQSIKACIRFWLSISENSSGKLKYEIVLNIPNRIMVSFGYPTGNFNYHHFDLKSHRPNVLKRVVEPSLLDTYCYAALAILKHRPRETSVIETYLEMCESSFTNARHHGKYYRLFWF